MGDKVKLCQAQCPFRKIVYDGESVLAKFYAEELQKIVKAVTNDLYDIEHVIKNTQAGWRRRTLG